jgi:phosphate/sulfate permease
MLESILEFFMSTAHSLMQPEHLTWIFGVSFFLLFFQSMGIGANECGINFGPSAACETFSHRQLVLFACIFELVGILTMGQIVCIVIQSNVCDSLTN